MDGVFRIPPSPGTPLFPISPERINRQPPPQSPTYAAESSKRLFGDPFASPNSTSSDVKDKVAQFNKLNKEVAKQRQDNEAARRRAEMGREEAENESRMLSSQLEDSKARVSRVSQRLETVLEEKQRVEAEKQNLKQVYEKEIRRARKEAFKASSENIKLKEELKTARNQFTLMREEAKDEKRRTEQAQKEAFAAQYRLVGTEQELENAKQQMIIIAEERDALRTSLQEEEIARIAAEGRIPLPTPSTQDEFSTPRKLRAKEKRQSSVKETDPFVDGTENLGENEDLKMELEVEKDARQKAEDLIDFMKLECQLKRCSCRLAEHQRSGHGYIYDRDFDAIVSRVAAQVDSTNTSNIRTPRPEDAGVFALEEPLIEFSPSTGTFHTIKTPTTTLPEGSIICVQPEIFAAPSPCPIPSSMVLAPPLQPIPLSTSPSLLELSNSPSPPAAPVAFLPQTLRHLPTPPLDLPAAATLPTYHPSSPRPQPPATLQRALTYDTPHTQPNNNNNTTTTTFVAADEPTAHELPVRAVTKPYPSTFTTSTTTITVPLADPQTPSNVRLGATKTREEALRSIEKWRRGRSRSVVVNGTPRRAPWSEGGKRDCSAPVGRGGE